MLHTLSVTASYVHDMFADKTSIQWNRHVASDRRCNMLLPLVNFTTCCFLILIVARSAGVSGDDEAVNNDRGKEYRESANDASNEPWKLYGAEISWPMQRYASHDDSGYAFKYPNYVEYMNGCSQQYDGSTCKKNEAIRIQRNDRQPKLVPRNYTHAGYAKVAAPTTTFSLLREYWDRYSTTHLQLEHNNRGREPKMNIHMNHWSVPTKMLYLDPPPSRRHPSESATHSPPRLPHMPISNIHRMIEQVQSVLEQWTGVPLLFTSVYGIRSYTNHSILAPHIDRIPLVISAIVNVAQQVTDDWVLELIGHDGYAMNLTMQPGDMILYESHSILHGRPYPLNGQYYANCFFHFEPIGYTEQYYANLERRRSEGGDTGSTGSITIQTTPEKYEAALAKLALAGPKVTSQSLSTEAVSPPETTAIPLPYDIPEGTIEAQRWRQEFEFRRVALRSEHWEDISDELFPKVIPKKTKHTTGATNAHLSAAKNDVRRLRDVARTDPQSLDTPDVNGWLPLHEAARGGSTEAIRFLVEEIGVADINARTNDGEGGTALWWAEHNGLPDDHEIIQILKRNGAVSVAPFQTKKQSVGNNKVGATNKNSAGDDDNDEETEGMITSY